MAGFSKEIIHAFSVGGAVTIALFGAAAWYQLYFKKWKNTLPEKWTEVGTVTDLFIYPLKSGRFVKLDKGECDKTGLVFNQENKYSLKDRSILVYTEEGRKVRNAKHHPTLLLISVEAVSKNEIKLVAEGSSMSPLVINMKTNCVKLADCILWAGEVQQCFDYGSEAAKWISQYCTGQDSGLRLGFAAYESKRNVETEPMKKIAEVYEKITSGDLGIFSDISSYLIFNKASLEDLNKKLGIDISSLNFRPNIVVDTSEAYIEDHWDWIKIGDEVVFRSVKPCTRCAMVNFDPETGIPTPNQMVSKKLQEYRQVSNEKTRKIEGKSPVMGVYAGIRKPGYIKQGDKVYVG